MINLFFFLFSLSSIAAVSGDKISANKYNNATFQVGDIKKTALSLEKFIEIHGSCWRLMDGSSIVGTDLESLSGMSNLPNALLEGTFLRQAKEGRVVGSYQSDENKSHTHSYQTSRSLDGGGRSSAYIGYGQNSYRYANQVGKIFNAGGEESRPKNLAMNFFVKINKECF